MFRHIFAAIAIAQAVGLAHAQPVDLSGATAYPDIYQPSQGHGQFPRDLVLLGADLVEIAVALGAADRILARPNAVDLEGIEDTPHLLRERAGVEGVVALRPGVVVGSSVIYETLLAGLDDLGIQTLMIDRSLPAIEKVERMAELLGVQDRGDRLIAAIENDYASVKPVLTDGEPLRILHASKQGAGGNFSAGGSGTAVHNLIERVGAQNAAAEIGMDRYRSVTPERILTMAPDVVIISEAELDAFGDPAGLWEDYPGLALTPAGQNQRLVVMKELHVRADAASSGIAAAALSAALQDMFP